MATGDIVREQWATRFGFILAAVGSAVGLGNIWRFPFQVGQEGGSAFLLMYFFFILLIGLPAMLVEFTVGRRTALSPIGALREVGGGAWKYVGALFVLIGFVILSYYSVVAGWVLRYFVGSFTGAYMDEPGEYFLDIATGLDAVLFHAAFLAITVGIVAFGIQRGIELAVKLMVPAIIAIMLGLAIYAATLAEVGEAYSYYLSPDVDVLQDDWRSIVPAAAGQAFFTLSLGMGVMITYASYLGEDRNLAEDSGVIIAFDTGIAFLTGLIVFPILFAAGIGAADPGAGAIFVALAGAFAEIQGGTIIGILFFGMFAVAALSSAISLLEVVVSNVIDEYGIDRSTAATAIGGGIFLLGVPVALFADANNEPIMVDLYDILAAEILLVTGGILLMILVGWIYAEQALDELRKGIGDLGALGEVWIWMVRVPVIVVLIVSLYLAVTGYWAFLTTDFADFLGM